MRPSPLMHLFQKLFAELFLPQTPTPPNRLPLLRLFLPTSVFHHLLESPPPSCAVLRPSRPRRGPPAARPLAARVLSDIAQSCSNDNPATAARLSVVWLRPDSNARIRTPFASNPCRSHRRPVICSGH